MTFAELIPLAVKVSIMLLVFALGLKTDPAVLTFLVKRPSLLARSLLSINLVMPIIAAILVRLFSLHPPVGLMLVALALAPLPPILPGKQAKAGADMAYAISLLTFAALFALISIPLSVEVVGRFLGVSLHVPVLPILKLVLSSIIVPLGLGLLGRRFLPALAERASGLVSKFATLLLVVAVIPILIGAWKGILAQIGDGTVVALALFTVGGLAVGHLLGGPDPSDRTVLALSTASRHPGVSLALVHMAAPDAKAAMPLLLLYLFVSAVVGAPYVAWRKKAGVKLPTV
jgi:BASS family bile acid:Na+ symporter